MFKILKKIFSFRKKSASDPKNLYDCNLKDPFLDEFNRLTEEIRFLIEVSSILWIQEKKFQDRLRKIYNEVNKLDRFVRHKVAQMDLSEEKKEDLLRTLKFSKNELLKTIESAPCPTDFIQ